MFATSEPRHYRWPGRRPRPRTVRFGAGEKLDEPLLGGVDVLVLIHDQVTQSRVDLGRELWSFEFTHGPDDLLTVGQEPVSLEGRVIVAQHGAKWFRYRCRVEQFVLHDVNALAERFDRGKEPVA